MHVVQGEQHQHRVERLVSVADEVRLDRGLPRAARALAIASGSASIAVTRYPSLASHLATVPSPHPASSKRAGGGGSTPASQA